MYVMQSKQNINNYYQEYKASIDDKDLDSFINGKRSIHEAYEIERENRYIYHSSKGKYVLFNDAASFPNGRESLCNFLTFAASRIPNFYELAMLDVNKVNAMFFEFKLPKDSVDNDFKGSIESAYDDWMFRYLSENCKINELIDAMNKDEDLRLLKPINDHEYVLNEKFWKNLVYGNTTCCKKVLYEKLKYRRFNKKSAKIFTFLITHQMLVKFIANGTYYIFSDRCKVRFSSYATYDESEKCYRFAKDNEETVSNARICHDNTMMSFIDLSTGHIEYLHKEFESKDIIDYYEFYKYYRSNLYLSEESPRIENVELQEISRHLFTDSEQEHVNVNVDNDKLLLKLLSKTVWYLEIYNFMRLNFIWCFGVFVCILFLLWYFRDNISNQFNKLNIESNTSNNINDSINEEPFDQ